MIYCGTGYTTLDDLENRLDGAVERGELTEREAWYEFQEVATKERCEQEMDDYMQQRMMEWLFDDKSNNCWKQTV